MSLLLIFLITCDIVYLLAYFYVYGILDKLLKRDHDKSLNIMAFIRFTIVTLHYLLGANIIISILSLTLHYIFDTILCYVLSMSSHYYHHLIVLLWRIIFQPQTDLYRILYFVSFFTVCYD
jgi:hypothetical protein